MRSTFELGYRLLWLYLLATILYFMVVIGGAAYFIIREPPMPVSYHIGPDGISFYDSAREKLFEFEFKSLSELSSFAVATNRAIIERTKREREDADAKRTREGNPD